MLAEGSIDEWTWQLSTLLPGDSTICTVLTYQLASQAQPSESSTCELIVDDRIRGESFGSLLHLKGMSSALAFGLAEDSVVSLLMESPGGETVSLKLEPARSNGGLRYFAETVDPKFLSRPPPRIRGFDASDQEVTEYRVARLYRYRS